MANYQLWYARADGTRIGLAQDVISFRYVRVYGDIGIAMLQYGRNNQLYQEISPDYRIYIYRQPTGGTMALETVVLLDRFLWTDTNQGLSRMRLTGGDGYDLLRRRIAAYYAGEPETDVSGAADDLMKEAVRDNLIDNADYSGTPSPSRSISSHFSVSTDTTDGPTVNKSFAWVNLLTILQGLQASSKTAGTEVFFSVMPNGNNFKFDTTINQPGTDRTANSGTNPLVFAPEWGNLSIPSLEYDYSLEKNIIYAGGQGQGDARTVQTAIDTSREGATDLSRREGFVNASRAQTGDSVTGEANESLARSRRRFIFAGELLDTPRTPYGTSTGWNLGDKVTISYAGLQFDAIIRGVTISVSRNGQERVIGKVENVNA